MKSSKEKKRKHSRREEEETHRKRRSAESRVEDVNEDEVLPREAPEQQSDLEEGGLDLTKTFKPISSYVSDRQEMLEQCFNILGQDKLRKMLPEELKSCTFAEIRMLCWDQLEKLSETNLLQILEGKELTTNSETNDEELKLGSMDSQQDNNVDSTSSVKEAAEPDYKHGASGEDSDVLSINADVDDSDIEGHTTSKQPPLQTPANTDTPALTPAPPEPDIGSDKPKLELQRDIDRSVSEILALATPSSSNLTVKTPLQPVAMETDPTSLPAPTAAPSAQQLALLELEMRARAIKALMKAGEVKK